ncbi:MAG: hypothetical protein HC845_09560 [Akkermansiaceae bacterium]|nr:hypothetical protein [Akkermansiaceae bacterium]
MKWLVLLVFSAVSGAVETKNGANHHRLVKIPAGTYALGDADHALNKPHTFKTPSFSFPMRKRPTPSSPHLWQLLATKHLQRKTAGA